MNQEKIVEMLQTIDSASPKVGEKIGWNNALISLLKGVNTESQEPHTVSQTMIKRSVHSTNSVEVERELLDHKRTNSKLNAVKYIKDITGMGLKESKEFVDELWPYLHS